MGDLRLFLPITKVDQAKRLVYGIAANESPDAADEVFDYTRSKPHFEAWSEEIEKTTDGKSKGNLREQHGPIAAGKLTSIHFDDRNKAIEVAAKVVDDSTWRKVQEGVLTGFSIGGKYGARWKDPENPALYRYEAIPYEVSVVDVPANPSATFEMVKADGEVKTVAFKKKDEEDRDDRDEKEIEAEAEAEPDADIDVAEEDAQKADNEERTKRVAGEDLPASAFAYVGDPERTATWKLPIKFSTEEKTKTHIRNALARFNQTEGIPESERAKVKAKIMAAAKRYGIDADDAEKAIGERLDGLEKALSALLERIEKRSNDPKSEVDNHMDLEKAHSAAKHLEKVREEVDRHKERHERHVAKVHELLDKCEKALGSGPAEDVDDDEEIAEGPDAGGDIEEGLPKARHEKAITKADLEKAIQAAFEAGVQTVATAIKGQAAPAAGIGDRGRVVPVTKTVAVAAETAESDAVLARKYAAGDAEAGLALMKKSKPTAVPARAMAILGGRR
jgi:hypothetical protein